MSNFGLQHFLTSISRGVANAILGVFHLHSPHPQAPITNYVAMQIVVFMFLVIVFVAGASDLIGRESNAAAARFREPSTA